MPGGPPVRLADGVLHGRGRGRRQGCVGGHDLRGRAVRSDLPARVVVVIGDPSG
ncbi:hypothetical protein [Streptomyces mirabilis]